VAKVVKHLLVWGPEFAFHCWINNLSTWYCILVTCFSKLLIIVTKHLRESS
jgi:hypothetical protein